MKLFRPNAEFACCSSLSLCSVLCAGALCAAPYRPRWCWLSALQASGLLLRSVPHCRLFRVARISQFALVAGLNPNQKARLSLSLVCLSLEFDLSSIPPLCYEPNSSACAPTKAIRHNIQLSNAGKRRDPQKWQSNSIFHSLLSSIPISLAS